jgi:hypothetical protein
MGKIVKDINFEREWNLNINTKVKSYHEPKVSDTVSLEDVLPDNEFLDGPQATAIGAYREMKERGEWPTGDKRILGLYTPLEALAAVFVLALMLVIIYATVHGL